MPALEIIRGFKGTLDFYYWKGIPCVRKWPHTPRSHLTQGTLSASAVFVAIIQGYALLGGAVKTLYQEAAADQPRTGRDLFVTGTYGHLHESSMSEITDLITVANGYLETLIELTNALKSNNADRLIVKGEDQLFSFDTIAFDNIEEPATYGYYHITSDPVPLGKIWIITNICVINNTRALPQTDYYVRDPAGTHFFYMDTVEHALQIPSVWQGTMFFHAGSQIEIALKDSQNDDVIRLIFFGSQMSLEI